MLGGGSGGVRDVMGGGGWPATLWRILKKHCGGVAGGMGLLGSPCLGTKFIIVGGTATAVDRNCGR